MKSKYSLLLIGICLLVSSTTATAQDAVYKLLQQEWTVNADGTSDYHYRHEVQILRNRALVAYADKGETFVTYNPDLEDLTINQVFTVRPDGSRVEMPQNAYIYQLPSQCADCGRFNHIRELAMVHTGMEIGCIIVVDYTIHRRYNLINETLTLVRDCPIEKLEVKVTLPEDQELNVQFEDPGVLPFNSEVGKTSNKYLLKASNVQPRFVDSYLPADANLYPTLHFFNGNPEFIAANDDMPAERSAEIIRSAAEIAGNQVPLPEDGNMDKSIAMAMRDFVASNIHLNDLPPAMLGYVYSTPVQTWQSSCGTSTDRAVLLAALLSEAGFKTRVFGEGHNQVGVMFDTIEYLLPMVKGVPMEVNGKARNLVDTVLMEGEKAPALTPLEGGYYRLRLPAVQGAPAVNAANLALTRTAPLQGSACDLQCNITIPLPKGMKMVNKIEDKSLEFEGVGSFEYSVKQKGKKLKVVRNLKIEKSVIAPADYAAYRKLITAWQTSDALLLYKK